MDAPTSWRLCRFISQVNSQQIIAFSRSRHADLSSLSCPIPFCEFMFDIQILQSSVLQNLEEFSDLLYCTPYGRGMHVHASIRSY